MVQYDTTMWGRYEDGNYVNNLESSLEVNPQLLQRRPSSSPYYFIFKDLTTIPFIPINRFKPSFLRSSRKSLFRWNIKSTFLANLSSLIPSTLQQYMYVRIFPEWDPVNNYIKIVWYNFYRENIFIFNHFIFNHLSLII